MLTSLLPAAGIAVLSVLAAYYYHFTRSSLHSSARRRVLLFDGVCNVCNAFVGFVLDRDASGSFFFVPLQSPVGQQLLSKYQLPADLDSMVLIDHADDVVRHIQTPHARTALPAQHAAASSSSSASASPAGPLPPFPAASPSVAYIRSTAALLCLASLPFPLSLCCLLLLLPAAVRDAGYRAFAAIRYRAFGRSDECRLPAKEARTRFLDGSGGAHSTPKRHS